VAGDCWNSIGVRGDRSCPELPHHVHCHHCPTFGAAAQALLDRAPAAADVAEWTRHYRQPKEAHDRETQSTIIFRVGAEWLALPTGAVSEVADLRPVHSLPHRRGGALVGVANIRGELLVCVSLARLLGVNADAGHSNNPGAQRLLVLRRGTVRAIALADEVHGIVRIRAADLLALPTTVAKADNRHTRAVLRWEERSVGVVDEAPLFAALQRSLA
jgi:chemotaxis-related protein WspD